VKSPVGGVFIGYTYRETVIAVATLLMRSVMVSFRKIDLCFRGFFISVRIVR
jgi:hypothetical protein